MITVVVLRVLIMGQSLILTGSYLNGKICWAQSV